MLLTTEESGDIFGDIFEIFDGREVHNHIRAKAKINTRLEYVSSRIQNTFDIYFTLDKLNIFCAKTWWSLKISHIVVWPETSLLSGILTKYPTVTPGSGGWGPKGYEELTLLEQTRELFSSESIKYCKTKVKYDWIQILLKYDLIQIMLKLGKLNLF